MKRTIHTTAITLLVSSLLGCLMVFWAQAQTRRTPTPTPTPTPTRRNPTPTPTPEKKITIEETVLRREGNNKIVFKPEFELVNQSATGAVVRKKSAGTDSQPTRVIVGDVVCVCTHKPGSGSGACAFKVEGNTATCIESGGCTCKLGIKTKITS